MIGKKTIGLSQIVKNESHVIERMLNSILPFIDYITIVDTGSVDNTKEIIKKWCEYHKKDFSIYDMSFTNFAECRNYAMSIAKDKTDYSIWLDADEVFVIEDLKQLQSTTLDKDIYMVNTKLNNMKYTRNEIWNNKTDLHWIGPVHEYITHNDPEYKLTAEILKGGSVFVYSDGHSWNLDLSDKYYNQALKLEEYINTNKTTDMTRWTFFTAQSYMDSSINCVDKFEADERVRRAIYYYNKRTTMEGGYNEEVFFSKYKVADLFRDINAYWPEVLNKYLIASKIDPFRGEPYRKIVQYYIDRLEFQQALVYSTYAYHTYYEKNPYPMRLLYIEQGYYDWLCAYQHFICLTQCNKKKDGLDVLGALKVKYTKNKELFDSEPVFRDKMLANINKLL